MILQLPGSEFSVSSLSGTGITHSRIASNGTDTFICVWEGVTTSDPDSGIYAAFFLKDLGVCSLLRSPPSGDFLVAASTIGVQDQPDVDIDPQRRVVIAWTDRSGLNPKIQFKVFETTSVSNIVPADLDLASPLTSDELAYDNPTASQCDPKVSIGTNGVFAITWVEKTIGPSVIKLSVFSFEPTLTPIVEGLTISTGSTAAFAPEISVNALTNDFFVVWTADDSPDIIKGQKVAGTGTPVGPNFVISNPTISASSPRISVRPFTNDFVVSWLEDSTTIVGPVFDVYWRLMRHTASSPDGILGPIQIPGAFATSLGDINLYSDGSFVISWSEHINGDLLITQYLWSDMVPVTNGNAVIDPSSVAPHGGIIVNSASLPGIIYTSMGFTQDALIASYSDASTGTIWGRCIEAIDRQYLNDFSSFLVLDDQHIFANPLDSIPSGIIDAVFSNPGTSAPEPRDIADLDSFLDGKDILLLGGPITNSMSENLMLNGAPALITSIRATEALSIYFNKTKLDGSPLDGFLYGEDAPRLFISNLNNPTSFYELARTSDAGVITDYAVIFQLKGTTNRLIFIGGIRDFGTAIAAAVLENVRKKDANTNIVWESILDNHAAVLVKFLLPLGANTATVSSIVDAAGNFVGISTNDITLIPAQSVSSDSP